MRETVAAGLIVYWVMYFLSIVVTLLLFLKNGMEPAWLEAVSTFFVMAFTGFAGIKGLQLWREEAIARERADLAGAVLDSAEAVVGRLRTARAPTIRGIPLNAPTGGLERRLDYLDRSDEIFDRLSISSGRLKIYTGVDVEEQVLALSAVKTDIIGSLNVLIRNSAEPLGLGSEILIRTSEDQVFSSRDANDRVEERIKNAITQIENKCVPFVRLQVTRPSKSK